MAWSSASAGRRPPRLVSPWGWSASSRCLKPVGKGAKANHLAYLGDGDVGEGANIGAGTIFCNYDGYQKQQDTLIVWTEQNGTDMALSFQEPEGCASIWYVTAQRASDGAR